MIDFNIEKVERRADKMVLCDADCVAYWAAATCNEMNVRVAERRVDARMNQILDECRAETYTNYLTGKDNFRDGIATLQRYKGNRYDKNGRRITEQPKWLQECRQYIIEKWDGVLINGCEADDALSIHRATKPYEDRRFVISSIDKDLRINIGDHHNQNTGLFCRVRPGIEPLNVSIKTSPTSGKKTTKVDGVGQMFFYAQLLMGDSADWIKGLPKVTKAMKERWPKLRMGGCGPMAAVHVLKDAESAEDCLKRVWFCYKSYWREHEYAHWNDPAKIYKAGDTTAYNQLIEEGRLLWMQQKPNQMWIPEYNLQR